MENDCKASRVKKYNILRKFRIAYNAFSNNGINHTMNTYCTYFTMNAYIFGSYIIFSARKSIFLKALHSRIAQNSYYRIKFSGHGLLVGRDCIR